MKPLLSFSLLFLFVAECHCFDLNRQCFRKGEGLIEVLGHDYNLLYTLCVINSNKSGSSKKKGIAIVRFDLNTLARVSESPINSIGYGRSRKWKKEYLLDWFVHNEEYLGLIAFSHTEGVKLHLINLKDGQFHQSKSIVPSKAFSDFRKLRSSGHRKFSYWSAKGRGISVDVNPVVHNSTNSAHQSISIYVLEEDDMRKEYQSYVSSGVISEKRISADSSSVGTPLGFRSNHFLKYGKPGSDLTIEQDSLLIHAGTSYFPTGLNLEIIKSENVSNRLFNYASFSIDVKQVRKRMDDDLPGGQDYSPPYMSISEFMATDSLITILLESRTKGSSSYTYTEYDNISGFSIRMGGSSHSYRKDAFLIQFDPVKQGFRRFHFETDWNETEDMPSDRTILYINNLGTWVIPPFYDLTENEMGNLILSRDIVLFESDGTKNTFEWPKEIPYHIQLGGKCLFFENDLVLFAFIEGKWALIRTDLKKIK